MQKLKQRLQYLEQEIYWRWFVRYLTTITTKDLIRLYRTLEIAPEEMEIEELNSLLPGCQQQE